MRKVRLDKEPPISKELFRYDFPFSKEYEESVEPKIKEICDVINKSRWVYTAESCEGHTTENPSTNWGTDDVLLRLVVRIENAGMLLALIHNHVSSALPQIPYSMHINDIASDYIAFIFSFNGNSMQHKRDTLKNMAQDILNKGDIQ